ncbi:MAG: thiol-disulfide oxidoreductase DCC family protein [Gemmatimonadaceae bacterium]
MERPYTVVYDGECEVCGRLASLLARWDARRQLEIIPFQDPSVRLRFPNIPDSAYGDSLQLIGRAGTRWEGAVAVEQLLGILPRGWLLGWVFTLPFAGRIADRVYRRFARNRARLGCGSHCRARSR